MATEFGRFKINPGFDIFDEDSESAKVFVKALDIALRAPGAKRAYWGRQIEDNPNIWLFFDWDSTEDYVNFSQSNAHKPFIEELLPIFDFSSGFIKLVSTEPFPLDFILNSTQSPITEVLTMYFPSDISQDGKDAAEKQLGEFVQNALKQCPDFGGVSSGWSHEGDIPFLVGEGSGKILVAFIGWPTLAAHNQFRETTLFKENIGLVRSMPGMVKLGMFHVNCNSRAATS